MATRSRSHQPANRVSPGASAADGRRDEEAAAHEPVPAESFEATFARLEEISTALEAGGLPLEQSVDLYEEGMRLAQRCQELLTSVEQRIETLRQHTIEPGEAPR